MKIAVTSDLHLEFGDLNLEKNDADVLILGGDILIAQDLHDFQEKDEDDGVLIKRKEAAKLFRNFLKRCSLQYEHVIYIAGNHEFYHGSFPKSISYLKSECDKFENVHFLEMESKEIEDVVFIGCTLWTDMNKGDPSTIYSCQNAMNDYRIIRNSLHEYRRLRPEDTMKRHRDSLKFIKKTVEENPNKKYVVIGHHAPSKLSTKPQYENDFHLNGAYSSDLSGFILDHPQIKLWTHGHTHHEFDYMIGSTRIVCNPRGYIMYERDLDDPYFTQIVEV